MGLNNNDIIKKLRVALKLRDDDIVEVLKLVDFKISKGELGAFFRSEDHPSYMLLKDQILRNFLNGLVIYYRGPMPKKSADGDDESQKELPEKLDYKKDVPKRYDANRSDFKKDGPKRYDSRQSDYKKDRPGKYESKKPDYKKDGSKTYDTKKSDYKKDAPKKWAGKPDQKDSETNRWTGKPRQKNLGTNKWTGKPKDR